MRKMVTNLLAVAAIAAFGVSAATAAPLLTEDFSYAPASALVGQGGWAAHSGAGTNPQTVNTAGGLTYAGYPGSGVGALLGPTATSGEDTNKGFPGQSAGAVYLTAMINVASSQATGDYLLHYCDGLITSNIFLGRLFVKKDAVGTNYAFGIQFGSAAGAVYTPFSYTPGSTHLVVIKYQFVGGLQNDVVSLFVDPAVDCLEPVAVASHTNPGGTQNDAANLDLVCVRQGGAGSAASAQIDGLRVATTWAEATCDPITPTRNSTWGQVKTLYR